MEKSMWRVVAKRLKEAMRISGSSMVTEFYLILGNWFDTFKMPFHYAPYKTKIGKPRHRKQRVFY